MSFSDSSSSSRSSSPERDQEEDDTTDLPVQQAPSVSLARNNTDMNEFFSNFTVNARAYQMEMLHESLKGNIIVAVRTPPTIFFNSFSKPCCSLFFSLDGHWEWKNVCVRTCFFVFLHVPPEIQTQLQLKSAVMRIAKELAKSPAGKVKLVTKPFSSFLANIDVFGAHPVSWLIDCVVPRSKQPVMSPAVGCDPRPDTTNPGKKTEWVRWIRHLVKPEGLGCCPT